MSAYEVTVTTVEETTYIVTVAADDADDAREQVETALVDNDVTELDLDLDGTPRKVNFTQWVRDEIGEIQEVTR